MPLHAAFGWVPVPGFVFEPVDPPGFVPVEPVPGGGGIILVSLESAASHLSTSVRTAIRDLILSRTSE